MLIGQYTTKVSDKGRVAFPKKFREKLGTSLIITRGYEGCLLAVSQKDWETLLDGTSDKPFIFGAARDTTRFLLGNATQIDLDTQGRFILPAHLRSYAKVKNQVVFLGLKKYVEIWAKDTWETYQEFLSKNIDKISEKLNGYEKK